MNDKVIMLGNEAIARGVFEAGVKLSSAYPGTPSFPSTTRFTPSGLPTKRLPAR